jgi:hypothetical protein
MDKAVSRAADAVALFAESGIEPVMNQFNRRSEEDAADKTTDCGSIMS